MIIGNIIIIIVITAIIIVVTIQTPLHLPDNDYDDYDSYVDYFDDNFKSLERLDTPAPAHHHDHWKLHHHRYRHCNHHSGHHPDASALAR